VVSADGRAFRHAPLPDPAPRIFATIAASLLDEIIAPPEPGPQVNVDVHVDVGPSAPPAAAPPSSAQPQATDELPAGLGVHATDTLLEMGPAISPISYGFEGELSFPTSWLHYSTRLGISGAVHKMWDGANDMPPGTTLGVGALELRYVSPGETHLDIGAALGFGHGDNGDTGGVFSIRLILAHSSEGQGVQLSLAPTFLLGFRGNSSVLAGGFASLRWELPI
jgi:hypothetical protein